MYNNICTVAVSKMIKWSVTEYSTVLYTDKQCTPMTCPCCYVTLSNHNYYIEALNNNQLAHRNLEKNIVLSCSLFLERLSYAL